MKYVAILLLGTLGSCAWATDQISPDRLSAEIAADGPKTVVLRYYGTEAWKQIENGVRSASTSWLEIAEKLRAVADADAGEELGLALYESLAVAPLRVLPTLARTYRGPIEDLCNVSYEAAVPKEGVAKYLERIEMGLRRAKSEAERSMATACRRGLKKSLSSATSQGLL